MGKIDKKMIKEEEKKIQRHIKNKTGFNSKIHLVVNKFGMSINFIVIDGVCTNCRKLFL